MLKWGRLTDLVNNSKRLDFNSAFFFVFSQDHIQLFAIELNTGSPNNDEYGQLFLHGVDAEGTPLTSIGGDYAPITKDIKLSEGLPIDRVTLYQDGDFYRSWNFQVNETGFTLSADTIKKDPSTGQVDDLQDRWGSNLVGLTNESIKRLSEELVPEVIRYILSTLLQ